MSRLLWGDYLTRNYHFQNKEHEYKIEKTEMFIPTGQGYIKTI